MVQLIFVLDELKGGIAGFTVTEEVLKAKFPSASVIFTVYIALTEGQTFIVEVLAPVLQLYVYGTAPPDPVAVKFVHTDGGHIEAGLVLAVIVHGLMIMVFITESFPQAAVTTNLVAYMPGLE